MIILYRPTGTERIEWFAKKASTVMAFSEAVTIDSNGYIAPSTATSTPGITGLVYRQVKATDSDYASTTRVPVLVPRSDTVFLADVGTGTAAQTNIGEFKDLADSKNVDVTADTYGHVFVVDVISTSQVLVRFAQKGGPAAG